MKVTIFHNPACGTSRKVLAAIRAARIEPKVVEYLKTPPDRATLEQLVVATGGSVRALLREKAEPYTQLGLGDPEWSDAELIGFIVAHPILLNRPIVVTPLGARLCRPAGTVVDLLPKP